MCGAMFLGDIRIRDISSWKCRVLLLTLPSPHRGEGVGEGEGEEEE